MVSIDERYYQLHPKSAAISKQAEDIFPDGVTHDGRKAQPFRVYMSQGLGPKKWDIDGTETSPCWRVSSRHVVPAPSRSSSNCTAVPGAEGIA